uniref:SDR family NAD(P)-dependent oxidoreductase n=1 Tax=Rhabditophanes sp. KR3021 TaxID=114890 RepID=A0AC35U4B5_9BILA
MSKVVNREKHRQGIGLELVETCFKNNATVVALIRDGKKGRQLFEDIRQKYPKSTGEIDSYYMDLSKMNTVMDAALYVIQNYRKVDVLINNGAIGTLTSHQLTTTGNELVMQTNYFGPLFLTLQLLPLIRSTKGRIISMSSFVYEYWRFDKNFHRNTSEYSSVQAYANSKLAIVGMTIKLAELIDSDECTIVCASPGIVDTPISKYFTNAAFGPLWSDKLYPLTSYVTRRLFKSPHTASSQIMSLATIKNPNKFHGQYVSQHMITRVAKGRELFYEIWNDSFKVC